MLSIGHSGAGRDRPSRGDHGTGSDQAIVSPPLTESVWPVM
jgi:hypothetical protein